MLLSAEWSRLMDRYAQDHGDPRNQACHKIGIPLIAASVPVAGTIVGIPLAAMMFTVGWGFQLAGHAFEGNKPSLVRDGRYTLVGLLWWMKKMGLPIETRAA
jgi:uncharacterized membrane protein YGL010W